MKPYTVVVTSCRRPDLLKATLQTLLPRLTGNLKEIVVIEDSPDESVRQVANEVDRSIKVIINKINLGQLRSIDRAYSEVKTDYIFHCEDDWNFFGEGFIEPSYELLKQHAHISVVSLRPRAELNPKVRNQPRQDCNGIAYFEADPDAHQEYFGYSFNPGLRRMSDYRLVGPFGDLRGERAISYCFKKLGYRMAYLEEPAVSHSGFGRHVDDLHSEKRPRSSFQKFKHSLQLRVDRARRILWPSSDPARQIADQTGPIGSTRLHLLPNQRKSA